MHCLEKLEIIKDGLTVHSSPVLLVKRKHQSSYRFCRGFCILNDKLVKISHVFTLVLNCILAISHSHCEVMSEANLREAYYTLELASDSEKYCGIIQFYVSSNTMV